MKYSGRWIAGWGFLLIAGCSVLVGACSSAKLVLREPGEALENSDSEKLGSVIERWTRQVQVHNRWATILDVEAIFLSWDFRRLQVDRFASDTNLSKEVHAAKRAREKDLFEGYVEFYLAVFTTKSEWNKLDDDTEDPAWKVFFINDSGAKIPDFKIEKVVLDPAMLYAFFPNINRWQVVYRVSFPRRLKASGESVLTERNAWFGLQFTGYLGEATLKWHLMGAKP
jgi:hypothetical protein